MGLLSITEYAVHAGVSQPTVSAWVKKGKIPTQDAMCEDGKIRKKIDPILADAAREANISKTAQRKKHSPGRPPGRPKKPTAAPEKKSKIEVGVEAVKIADESADGRTDLNLTEAQQKKENMRAALLELEYLEKRGVLVNKKEHDAKILEILNIVAQDLKNMHRKADIIAELVAIDDLDHMERRLQEIIHGVLEPLARTIKKKEEELGL